MMRSLKEKIRSLSYTNFIQFSHARDVHACRDIGNQFSDNPPLHIQQEDPSVVAICQQEMIATICTYPPRDDSFSIELMIFYLPEAISCIKVHSHDGVFVTACGHHNLHVVMVESCQATYN